MKKSTSHKGEVCRNCKNAMANAENFCPNCGQENDVRRHSISEYVSESLGNFFSFDTKIIRSLVPFLIRPGILSRRYVDGEKVKFVVPFRMYMFFSLVFFLVANALPDKSGFDEFFKQDIPSELAFTPEGIEKSDSLRADSTFMISRFQGDALQDDFDLNDAFNYAIKHPDTPAALALRYIGVLANEENIKKYDLYMKFVRMDRLEFANYVLDKFPLLIFLFMPLLTLVLKLFYIRRDIYYSEHLTFLLQSNSMIFLLATLGIVLNKLCSINISLLAIIFFTVYFYIAMKNFYQQGWLKTLLKFVLLGFCYFLLFPIFTVISIGVMYFVY